LVLRFVSTSIFESSALLEGRNEGSVIYRNSAWTCEIFRKLIIRLTFQFPACEMLASSAPLFEKEGDSGHFALISETDDPVLFDRAGSGTAFAADDDPIDAGKIELA